MNQHEGRLSRFVVFATVILVVAVFRWAREIIIPLALATVLAFLLSPLVVRLVRWGFNRVVAVILTVTFAIGVFIGLGWMVAAQGLNVVQELPKYEKTIEAKIAQLRQPHTPPVLAQAARMFARIQTDLKASEPVASAKADSERAPVPVEVEPPKSSLFEISQSVLASLLKPLTTLGIVIVFLVAMLLQWDDLHDRVIRITHTGGFALDPHAIEDAAQRVSRYLSMQLVVNASYGVPIALGLYFIGIPNASLWGLLSTLLRFIPYLGPWIAAAFPLTLALAIDPGWTKVAWTLGLYVVAETLTANFLEVWIYGVRTGVSSLGLLVAAVFWTWLWGPVGLFLSTPLTVCLVVIGKYLPGLKVFNTMLSNEHKAPARTPRR